VIAACRAVVRRTAARAASALAAAALAAALGAALAAVPACAGRPAQPTAPTTEVRAEIDRAETAERARRHDEARAHYQRAVAAARDPESVAFACREFAETLVSWGEYPEAIAQLERSLAARPHPGAWHDLGLLRNNRGDVRGALAALEQARALAPRDIRPRVALAALRWKTGDRAGAAAEYRALLELDLPERLRAKVQWALGELAKR
jgi:tetratricopeptide (TPR) repeat protein